MFTQKIVPVIAGFIGASIVMMVFEYSNSLLFPFPDGFDTSNLDALRSFAAGYSPYIFFFVLAGWFAGSVCGGYITAYLAKETQFRMSAIVGVVLVLAGILNHLMFQHPLWFNCIGLFALFGGAYFGYNIYQHKDNRQYVIISVASVLLVAIALCAASILSNREQQVIASGPSIDASFFVTSKNPGKGGDLGGLAGADAYCTTLAESAGIKGKTWAAYLSSTANGDSPVVHARDRIGTGPWRNTQGVVIASNIEELHTNNNLTKETALSELGKRILGKGDTTNMHDILTGSNSEGYASDAAEDTTCSNWTSGTNGSALVGHHDRVGRDDSAPMKSWNAAHPSRGCSLEGLKSTGGAGLFYCFARE